MYHKSAIAKRLQLSYEYLAIYQAFGLRVLSINNPYPTYACIELRLQLGVLELNQFQNSRAVKASVHF